MNPSIKIKKLTIGGNEQVRLMSAVNLSTESFYKGSIIDYTNESSLEKKFKILIDEGSEIFDFGPKSSAPISLYGTETNISENEEIKRISKPLKVLKDLNSDIIISIDTQSSKVADYAFIHGADIINDISGLNHDPILRKVIGDHSGYLIAMASNSVPGDVFTKETVVSALESSIERALKYIPKQNIIIDPGIGGWVSERTVKHDYQLILDVPMIKKQLQCPALIALSRKSFIGKILNLPPNERLNGSLAATAISVLYGADIIRTHDVKETKQVISIAEQFKRLL